MRELKAAVTASAGTLPWLELIEFCKESKAGTVTEANTPLVRSMKTCTLVITDENHRTQHGSDGKHARSRRYIQKQ